MLQLWMGRARTGKSTAVLEAIRQEGEAGRQILLVPEHASHQAEIDLCRVCGNTAGRHSEVLTFRLLAGRVLSAAGVVEPALDQGGKLLLLETVLRELAPQLTVYSRPSHRVAFLESMLSLFDELQSYGVDVAELLGRTEQLPGGEKLRDLALLYGAYQTRLCREGGDLRDRMSRMLELLDQHPVGENCSVYLDGFSYFNRQEEQVLRHLLRRGACVTVTLLDDPATEEEAFREARACAQRLKTLAQDCGQGVKTRWFTRSAAQTPLDALEERFFTGEAYCGGCGDSVRLLEAATPFTEVEQAAARIRTLVCTEGYRWREIGVMVCQMETYGPLIEEVFARYEVPVFRSARSEILEKPVLRMLLSALEAVTGGYEYEDVFRCLKTGLMGLTPQQCDLLENYVLKWDIHGSMWVREVAWTANPEGYGVPFTEATIQTLTEINRLRETVRQRFGILSDGLRRAGAGDKVRAVYDFLVSAGVREALEAKATRLFVGGQGKLAEEYAQLWQILCDVLDQFVAILGDAPLDGESFTRLLRLVLTQYSVGTIPVSLDQVNLCELGANDRHSIRCLFLLGANDHVLPAVKGGTGLLSPEERETLLLEGIRLAPTGYALLTLEMQNIYAAMARPTRHLTLSWPVADGSGAALRPSFLAQRLMAIFPGLTVQKEGEEKAWRLCAPLTALEAAGEEPGGPLWQYFAGLPAYAGRLQAMERAAVLGRGELSPAAVQALYGQQMSMSASRMDKAKSCHFSYFMQYGLRAKARRPAGFDAPEIGSFLHFLLEKVTREAMAAGGFGALSQEALEALMDRYIREYVEREMGNFADRTPRFHYLFGRLRRVAATVIRNVAEELSVSDFVPVAFELSFGQGGQLPAVTVRQGEAALSLTGKVDRVDGWIKDDTLYLRVVDYKTGRKSFQLSEVRYGLGIQMLLYLFTLQQQGEPFFGHPVAPAGVLYLPAQEVLLRTEGRMEAGALRAMAEKSLTRSGMLLGEPEVLQAMEHSVLQTPRFLPVKVGRSGELSGGPGGVLASAGQLGQLGRYVNSLLSELLQELTAGNVDADPCTLGTAEESVCRYCEFAAACHFEPGQGRDRLRYIRKTAAEEFWTLVEQGGEHNG